MKFFFGGGGGGVCEDVALKELVAGFNGWEVTQKIRREDGDLCRLIWHLK